MMIGTSCEVAIGAQATANLEAGHAGEHQVEEHEDRLVVPPPRVARCSPSVAQTTSIALVGKVVLEDLEDVRDRPR